MDFLDRHDETSRLDALMRRRDGGLAVVYGRRRIGKTRLLVEWTERHGGVYTVADRSASELQRRYFAEAVSTRLEGFADVGYPDWNTLLDRLARDAENAWWRGPLVIDELPYLVESSPELPSVLQRWIDHAARRRGLVVALAGSVQRMMQGLVLDPGEPLYGRAHVVLPLAPLAPAWLRPALRLRSAAAIVEAWAAWGGVPRYWELAAGEAGDTRARIERLVLDPLGPLHQEPQRLLLEEIPPALELRPILDATGGGAHRVSDIASRTGHKATSLSRPLERLAGMGLVTREVPFGEPERSGKRSLYRIADPFFRLWFRVVAPHRAFLTVAPPAARLGLLDRYWPRLVAAAWEGLCRERVARVGPFGAAKRWWWRSAPEWDVVAESIDDGTLLLGEVKWSATPFSAAELRALARALQSKPPPTLPARFHGRPHQRALFVPRVSRRPRGSVEGVQIHTAADLL